MHWDLLHHESEPEREKMQIHVGLISYFLQALRTRLQVGRLWLLALRCVHGAIDMRVIIPLVLVAISPWAFSTSVESSFTIPKTALFIIAVSLMVVDVVTAGQRWIRGGGCFKWGYSLLGFFFLWVVTSLSWCEFPVAGVPRVFFLLIYCMIFFYASNVSFSTKQITGLLSIMVTVATTQAVLALFQWLGLDPFFGHVTALFNNAEVTQRIIGTVGYQNTLGGFLALMMPLSWYLALISKSIRQRSFWLVCSALIFAVIVLTRSRGVWIAGVLGSCIFGVSAFASLRAIRGRYIIKYGATLFVIVTFLTVMTFKDKEVSVFQRASDLMNGKSESFQQRALIWKVTAEIAKAKPITGHGLGSFSMNYLDYLSFTLSDKGNKDLAKYAINVKEAHNDYLQMIAELGFTGLTLWVFFLIVATGLLIKTIVDTKKWIELRLRACAVLSSLVVFLVLGMVSFPLQVIGIAPFFWLLLGLGLNMSDRLGSDKRIPDKTWGRVRIFIILLSLGTGLTFASRLLYADRLFLLGRSALALNDSSAASDMLERAASCRPWDGRLRFYYGISLSQDGWADFALDEMAASTRSFSDIRQWINMAQVLIGCSRLAEAGIFLERAYATHLDRRRTTIALAGYKLSSGHADDGVAMFRQLLIENKFDTEAMTFLGRYLISVKDLLGALDVFIPLAGVDEGSVRELIVTHDLNRVELAESLDLYGVALILSGEPASAIRVLRSAVISNPSFVSAFNNLGACYRLMGNESQAKRAWEKVLFLDPDNEKAHKNLYIEPKSLLNE